MKTIVCLLLTIATAAMSATAQSPNASQGASSATSDFPLPNPPLSKPDAVVATAISSAYLLRPSDVVQITVYRQPDLTTLVRLAGDGSITFPLIGRVTISGKTAQEAQDVIAAKLGADYLVNPHVTITITEYTKQYFTVLGQVQRPGAYEFPDDGKLPLLQGIGMAGGFTRLANTARVVVKRKIGGEEKVIKVNATKLAYQKTAKGFLLQSGDTISVPESLF